MTTSVEGNRVTIDGENYLVTPAGTDRYAVSDDFGGALGYFSLQGKVIKTDDYGVAGAPALKEVGRLWRDANDGALDAKPKPQSRMVAEVLTLTSFKPEDVDQARAHTAWLQSQPGIKAAFYAHDDKGKAIAVRIWKTRANMEGKGTPPDTAKELPSSSTEVLALIDDI